MECAGDPLEHRAPSLAQLELFPVFQNIADPRRTRAAEDVRMTPHQFIGDPGEDPGEREFARLFRDRGMHGDVEHQIAELL